MISSTILDASPGDATPRPTAGAWANGGKVASCGDGFREELNPSYGLLSRLDFGIPASRLGFVKACLRFDREMNGHAL